MNALLTFALFFILFVPNQVHAASIEGLLEAQYSEAVLAFNERKYLEAMKIVDDILKKAKDNIQYLELKALCLKQVNNPDQSIDTYEKLITATKKKGKPDPSKLGAYHFELGTMYFQKKKLDFAKTNFVEAEKMKINVGPSNFFLGMIAFQNNAFPDAEASFKKVLGSPSDELKPVAMPSYNTVLRSRTIT